MVKVAVLLSLVLLCAVPLLAQDDYPKIQTSLGYANLNLIDLGKFDPLTGVLTGETAHHSGFANAQKAVRNLVFSMETSGRT